MNFIESEVLNPEMVEVLKIAFAALQDKIIEILIVR